MYCCDTSFFQMWWCKTVSCDCRPKPNLQFIDHIVGNQPDNEMTSIADWWVPQLFSSSDITSQLQFHNHSVLFFFSINTYYFCIKLWSDSFSISMYSYWWSLYIGMRRTWCFIVSGPWMTHKSTRSTLRSAPSWLLTLKKPLRCQ